LQNFGSKNNTLKKMFDYYFCLIFAIVMQAWHSKAKTITLLLKIVCISLHKRKLPRFTSKCFSQLFHPILVLIYILKTNTFFINLQKTGKLLFVAFDKFILFLLPTKWFQERGPNFSNIH
jgi:hypothetical protein